MAGFLRRKTKSSDAAQTKQKVSITQRSSPPPPPVSTPLFARFATSAQQATQQQQQQQTQNGSNGGGGAGELYSGSRIVSSPVRLSSGVRRENTTGGSSYRGYGASSVSIRSQSSTGQHHKSPSSSFQYDDRQPTITRQSLDKPLPPPANSSRRTPSRGGLPPPVSLQQSKFPPRSRTSLIISGDKPLPVAGEQQQAQQQVRAWPITGRKLSLHTSFQPPTPQQQPPGRHSPTITNLLDDEFDDMVTPQALTPRASHYRAGNNNSNNNSTGNGVGRSRHSIDSMPPEFSLYQEFNTFSASPPDSTQVVPASKSRAASIRSATTERKTSAATSQHSKAAFNSATVTPHSQPTPPHPSSSTMGNNNSVLAGNSIYTTTIAPMATRAFMDPAQGHSISPHFNPADLNSRGSMRRVGYSPSPPPPPGASPPVVQGSPYVQESSHFQQQQQQQQQQPPMPSSFDGNNYTAAPALSMNAPAPFSAPMIKGPRIFAAMAGVDTEAGPAPNAFNHHYQHQAPQPAFSGYQSNDGHDAMYAPNHHQPYAPPPMSNGYYNHALAPQGSQMPLSPPPSYSAHSHYDSSSVASLGLPGQDPSTMTRSDTIRTPRMTPSRPLPIPQHQQPQQLLLQQHHRNSSVTSLAKSLHRQSLGHYPPVPPVPTTTPPHSPPRPRKLSKARQPSSSEVTMMFSNGSSTSITASIESVHSSSNHGHGILKVHQSNGHRALAKSHAAQPPLPATASNTPFAFPGIGGGGPSRPSSSSDHEQPMQVDEETMRNAGIPLDDDPFAKAEGVRMLSPIAGSGADPAGPAVAVVGTSASSTSLSAEGSVRRLKLSSKGSGSGDGADKNATAATTAVPASSAVEAAAVQKVDGVVNGGVVGAAEVGVDSNMSPRKLAREQAREARRKERRERRAREKEQRLKDKAAAAAAAAANILAESAHAATVTATDDAVPEFEPIVGEELEAFTAADIKTFPLNRFVTNPQLLANLLGYFSFYDWCVLSSVTREIRILLVQSPVLREEVFERYLKTVGYSRWGWEDVKEPLSLSLQDLADYMRGVSTPSHEYARVARMYVHSLTMHPDIRDPSLEQTVRSHTASTRAYTRVVLRLRAQAEKEASVAAANAYSNPTFRSASTPPSASIRNGITNGGYSNGYTNGFASRPSSRAPSPAMSNYSHSQAHGYSGNTTMQSNASQTSLGFRSPLFRLKRAPLLRVFVPSPEGDWLSDKSVLECEEECKRAGVLHLMRLGDVVWDIAVGDEGNVGRLVYDGRYLVDLDYTFNPIGDLPKYIPTLAFPPSYFHRVIRTGAVTSNPVVHIDITPWGEEIASNLQLLQDRVKTETPQGVYHNVVRWVHRSSFTIRPPARVMQRGPSINGRGQPHQPRIPIPETENLFIDSGWYGTIVVETEGTNEALADLQDRCGPRAFPPRPARPLTQAQMKAQVEVRKVFRILREKSRPGEIWIKAVGVKERIL